MKPVVSIIIPVYNAEAYLHRCISAILSQAYEAWELILVDDGSTDASGPICDGYAAKDSRIKVVHQLNGGVSKARNKGLDCATGEWITFSDADDWLEHDALTRFMENSDDCDIIRSGYYRVSEDGTVESVCCEDFHYLSNKYDIYQMMEHSRYFGYLWNTCIRRFVIGNLRFPEDINWCEDHIFSLHCCALASTVKFIPFITYNYYIQPSSSLSHPKDLKQVVLAAGLELKAKWVLMSEVQRCDDVVPVLTYYSKMYYVIRTLYQGNYSYSYRNQLCKYARGLFIYVSRVKLNPSSRMFYRMNIPFLLKDCLLTLKFSSKA